MSSATFSASSAPMSIKQRQISHLAQQLTILSSRTEQLERLIVTTAEQASYLRLLGAYHASWFMAVGRVMTPGDVPSPSPPPPSASQPRS